MMHEQFERGDPPDRVYRGFVRRVKPGMDVHCTVLSPYFWKTYVHWLGRTLPCQRDRNQCQHCKLGIARKFLGYLFIRNESNGKLEHLELPLDASHDLRDLVGLDGELRGTRFHAKRRGGKKTGIVFDLKARIELIAPKMELPDDQAPAGILEYLWGVNGTRLRLAENENELPPREAM